jgi:FeS assembly SUF system protein
MGFIDKKAINKIQEAKKSGDLDESKPVTASVRELPDYYGEAGKELKTAPENLPSEENIIKALKTVYDPEIPINIYDLGLIYKIEIKSNGDVLIDMTLTSPTCPVADTLPQVVADTVFDQCSNIAKIKVRVIWDPPWALEMMSEEAKYEMDLDFDDLDIDLSNID